MFLRNLRSIFHSNNCIAIAAICKDYIITTARFFLYFSTRILPKKKTVVLRGFPAYEDNLISIYAALTARGSTKIVWVVDDVLDNPPVPIDKNTRLVRRGSVLDIYYSITSRFLFITHGHFLRKIPPNQVCVNLWHGIPFKRIGKLAGEIGRDDTYLVATSEFTRGVFSKSFGTHEKNIIITGQPRTDRMLSVNKAEVLRRIFPYGPLPDYVLLWLPTYRRTAYSKSQCDGDFYDNIFNCTSFSTSIFNSILSKNNAVCLVKPHPMSVKQSITDESNLYFIDEHWLHERRLSLYELIGATDCLISDISSVIADYMLLDNPIILLFEDIASYENSRGFSFSPITRYLPAKVNRNFDSFIVELENVLSGQDVYEERRAELKRLFFDFSDASAANRILDITMGGVSITK